MNRNLTAEQSFTEIAASIAPNPETATPPDKPIIMLKRIGSTTYKVAVYFSKTSKETMSDKVTRLIKNETDSRKAV